MVTVGVFAIFSMACKAGGGFSVYVFVSRGVEWMGNKCYVMCEMRKCFFPTAHVGMLCVNETCNVSPVPQLAHAFSMMFSMTGTVKECM